MKVKVLRRAVAKDDEDVLLLEVGVGGDLVLLAIPACGGLSHLPH